MVILNGRYCMYQVQYLLFPTLLACFPALNFPSLFSVLFSCPPFISGCPLCEGFDYETPTHCHHPSFVPLAFLDCWHLDQPPQSRAAVRLRFRDVPNTNLLFAALCLRDASTLVFETSATNP